jgi:DNA-binding NarL/FixJ family response regulator
MADDLRIVVLERGSGLTHELVLACQGSSLEVLGPVGHVEAAAVALREAVAGVVVIEHTGGTLGIPLPAAIAGLRDARVLVMTGDPDPAMTAAIVSMGAVGVLERGAARRVVVDALRRVAADELVVPATHLPALLELSGIERSVDERASRMRTLTRREREVLILLTGGRTTGEIADSLSISALTVQSHVKNILAKLGVHSKIEAMRYGWRSGAIDVPLGA